MQNTVSENENLSANLSGGILDYTNGLKFVAQQRLVVSGANGDAALFWAWRVSQFHLRRPTTNRNPLIGGEFESRRGHFSKRQ
jgi:hypothetical protein